MSAQQSSRSETVDLFAGPGGWDVGAGALGLRPIGLEWDKDACATRAAAGHLTIRTDVSKYPTEPFVGKVRGLIASPPCQTYSRAGKGAGRDAMPDLLTGIGRVARGEQPADTCPDDLDPRSMLALEPMRWMRDLRPEWLACEQVPDALPLWRETARHLREMGYSTWAGTLNAADYGVPQSRTRAILLASRVRTAVPPAPTHADLVLGDDLFGGSRLLPWVSMAEGLGWTGPAPDGLESWAWQRPATTVVRSFRPEVVAAPAYRTVGSPSRQNAPGSHTVTDRELCLLQGIRPDYPFAGAQTKRRSLIGAILPPPWATAILKQVAA